MGFEIILCDEKVYKSILHGIPRENQTFQLIKNLRPPAGFESKRQKANHSVQRSAIAWAKSFSLFYEQKFLLSSQRRKQCTIQ